MRRQKQGRRLQEINARRREEKVLSAPLSDPLLGLFVRTGSLNSNNSNKNIWSQVCRQTVVVTKTPGGDSYMKQTGMLVVSLRGVNFGFWSRLGCSGQSANILSHQGLV